MSFNVPHTPNWLTPLPNNFFTDKKFIRIIQFFVINTPCKTLSVRCKTLEDYGWHSPWKKPYKLNEQLKAVSSSDKLIYSADTYDKISVELAKCGLDMNFPNIYSAETVCIYNNTGNQFISVFYHIRNSLAHGRYVLSKIENSKDWIFCMEDVQGQGNLVKVSARMVLRLSTLTKWIEIIEGGERPYKT